MLVLQDRAREPADVGASGFRDQAGRELLKLCQQGLLLPAVAALALQLAQMLPLPLVVRLALTGYAFISWNGLFTRPAQLGPLLVGVATSLAWAVMATALAYVLFMRRDFTNPAYDGAGR